MRTAAFFDLDRTLIDVNSGLLWAKHERKRGAIGRGQMLRSLAWTALYHLSMVDMERAYGEAVAHYRGQSRDEMEALTHRWFHSDVASHVRPQALEVIQQHRAQDHHLVILTSASCFEASAASETWGFDGWIANDFPAEDGLLTGEFVSPLVYGAGKVHHAHNYVDTHGISLDKSYFYSDSLSDRPMLEAVGHPQVVCPDPRLRRLAKKRGWPILAW